MRLLYSTSEYKAWHKRRVKKCMRKLVEKNIAARRGREKSRIREIEERINRWVTKPPVSAPDDLRLMHNLERCLDFFRDLRSELFMSRRKNIRYTIMSLRNVTQIDYGTVSILTAINDEMRFRKVTLKTLLPIEPVCKQFMIDSGYLNNLYNEKGQKFPATYKSDLLFFEKGSGRMSEAENKTIHYALLKVIKHLGGEPQHCLPIKTVILEICANSIEWSGTNSKQWLLGIKYEPDKVVFTVSDVGRGILDSLHREFTKRFFEAFKSADEILDRAFDQKYGSNTQEANRNKGLPSIKRNFELGVLERLKVLTNNVILHFDDNRASREIRGGSARFKGTFYQWELTANSLNNIQLNHHENN